MRTMKSPKLIYFLLFNLNKTYQKEYVRKLEALGCECGGGWKKQLERHEKIRRYYKWYT